MNKNIFRCKDISSNLWLRTYNAIIVNLLLWGCESWALKEEDQRRIEVFHHRWNGTSPTSVSEKK
jgi:hypothetical protein